MKLLNLKALLFGTALTALLCSSASALTYSFSFQNTGGNVGSPTDIVSGKIYGLLEGANFQDVTVTIESILPGPPAAGFVLPASITGPVVANITAGIIDPATFAFSKHDDPYDINLTATYFALKDFSGYYSVAGPVTFSLVPTPDSGSTVFLFGAALAALVWVRRMY